MHAQSPNPSIALLRGATKMSRSCKAIGDTLAEVDRLDSQE